MTDLEKWLTPKDRTKEMAAAYAGGKTVTQISMDFGYPRSTTSHMLRDYIPTKEDVTKFKMKFAAKRIKNKKYEA